MSCEKCRLLSRKWRLESPRDLEKILLLLKDCILKDIAEEVSSKTLLPIESELHSFHEGDPFYGYDHISHLIRCKHCHSIYSLMADTYHGRCVYAEATESVLNEYERSRVEAFEFAMEEEVRQADLQDKWKRVLNSA